MLLLLRHLGSTYPLAQSNISSRALSSCLSGTHSSDPETNFKLDVGRALAYGLAASVAFAWACPSAHAQQAGGGLPAPPTREAASHASEGTHLVSLRKKQELYFLYEKRIREFSNAEKVYEYFANDRHADGTARMRPQDLLAALVAVYPSDGDQVIRSGSLPGEPQTGLAPAKTQQVSEFFMKHFDIDDDGFIDFPEYLLIITLLSIPVQDAETAFAMLDTDDSGCIDKVEFEAVTEVLKKRSNKAAGAGSGRSGFDGASKVNEAGLMVHFFGADGEKQLDLATFNSFLHGLHHEIDRLEFNHYDPYDKGYITGRDFAHSMIASVNLHAIHDLLSKVSSLPEHLQRAKILRSEFEAFTALWRKVHALTVATDLTYHSVGHFRKDDLKRASRKITGLPLSDTQIDIIYSLFDVDSDGSLRVSEFTGVIKQRESRHAGSTDAAVAAEMQSMGLVQCIRTCCGL